MKFPKCPSTRRANCCACLQEQEVRPVGGKASYKTNCRIVAATNRQTEEAIKDGKLREDLFYRISAISVYLPPLRERREDILPLANAFLQTFRCPGQSSDQRLHSSRDRSPHRFRLARQRPPVAKRNSTRRSDLRRRHGRRDRSVHHQCEAGNEQTMDTNFTLMEGVERNAIVQMLKETGGNKLETAKRLGIGRQTLYNKIKAYGIEVS